MAEIQLNEADWSKLSTETQDRITAILQETGLLKVGDSIVPSIDAPPFSAVVLNLKLPGRPTVCVTLCDVAQAAAHAACALLGDPVSIAACNVAAIVAGNACRAKCSPPASPSPTPNP